MKIDFSYNLILKELESRALDLLGLEFFDGSSSYQTFVGSRFIWLDRMHLEEDYLSRNAEIIKLKFLFKHLDELRINHKTAYKRARKLLRKAKKEDQYFGARMEVYTAASLVRAGIKFNCRESPDYELTKDFEGVFIECGSAHITGGSTDLVKKVSLSVINKCKKPYANRSTLLMLDITNPIFHGLSSENRCATDDIRASVSEAINGSGYGGVLLLSYGINETVTKIFSNFIRIDHGSADSKLIEFLNRVYPFGNGAEQPFHYTNQS